MARKTTSRTRKKKPEAETEVNSNSLWGKRKPGRPRHFETPDELYEACVGYFKWVEDNPLEEQKAFHSQGVVTKTNVQKMRAMTLNGLQLYVGVSHGQWSKWRSDTAKDSRPDLQPVMEWAEQVIYEQKFTGAAADLLNANIISRELGLADKQDVQSGVTVVFNGDDADL